MNFPDHSKLVVWDGGRAVRYVDKRGEVVVLSLAEAAGKNEIVERLKVAAKEVFAWADGIEVKKGKV
jgi:hypothetical protein